MGIERLITSIRFRLRHGATPVDMADLVELHGSALVYLAYRAAQILERSY